MTPKARILAAGKHRLVDRLPTDIWATSEVWQQWRAHFGVATNIEVYDQLEIDGIIGIAPPHIRQDLKTEEN